MQHGIIDYQASIGMLQAMRSGRAAPLVRVPWLDPSHVMKALDAGIYGVIFPMINSRHQAEWSVSSGLYPLPSLRCAQLRTLKGKYSAGDNHLDEADEQVVCFGMSETAEAMRNLKEVVSTPKLDGVYIGPADLPIG